MSGARRASIAATASIRRKWRKTVNFAIVQGKIIIVPLRRQGSDGSRHTHFDGSSLPSVPLSVISAAFARPADYGLPWRAFGAGFVPIKERPEHFQRSNEHFSRPAPLAGAFVLRRS